MLLLCKDYTTRVGRVRWVAFVLALGALAATPAQGSFLGLEPGDVIDTVGFTIDPGVQGDG